MSRTLLSRLARLEARVTAAERARFRIGYRTTLPEAYAGEGLSSSERELPIFFQIHAIGYRTDAEERKIVDMPEWV
jgi:hypothetical protein